MYPLEPMSFERKRREKRRSGRHRVHSRTKVVHKARQGKFERTGPPPIVLDDSRTNTERPARANTIAAARPLGPEPTTTASYSVMLHHRSKFMAVMKRSASARLVDLFHSHDMS